MPAVDDGTAQTPPGWRRVGANPHACRAQSGGQLQGHNSAAGGSGAGTRIADALVALA